MTTVGRRIYSTINEPNNSQLVKKRNKKGIKKNEKGQERGTDLGCRGEGVANLEQPVLAEHGLELPTEFAHRGDAVVGAGERPQAVKREDEGGWEWSEGGKEGRNEKSKSKRRRCWWTAPGPLFFYKRPGPARVLGYMGPG